MAKLSVQDASLASNDKVTLTKLLKLGMATKATKYTMTAGELGTSGLSSNALVALVRANVARTVDADGNEIRPKTSVATEVTVYNTGTTDFTLSMDLET